MVKVVSIGMYSSGGRFVSDNWYEALTWLKVNCDSLIIYCHVDYEKMYKIFNKKCDINIMETPDKDMNVKSYKFYNFKNDFWDVIRNTDFCIDSDEEISHMFFMYEEKLLCMLEVTDYENFLMIYYIEDNNVRYSSIISDIEHNKHICNMHKDDIDVLSDGEDWRPY